MCLSLFKTMVDTFEEYIFTVLELSGKTLILEGLKKIGLDMFIETNLVITMIHDFKDQYDELLGSIQEHYTALFDDKQNEFPTEKERISLLAHGMYELDTKCGIDEELTPDLTYEETQEVLMMLDIDEDKFRNIIVKYLKLMKTDEPIKDYFLAFARLIYTFNGYQAKSRPTAKQALEDAYGLSDPFGEMIEQIEKTIV